MANWTSVNDVMRDLSVAQGRYVPASLEIFSNTPPVFINADEHHFKTFGDVNFKTKAPDFSLIQEMISMVSDKKESIHDNSISNSESEMEVPRKNKMCRNVALKSILEELERKTTDRKTDISKSPSSMFRKRRNPNIANSSYRPSVKSDNTISKCEYTPTVLAKEYYNKYMENTKMKAKSRADNSPVEPIREIYVKSNPALEKKFQALDNSSSISCSSIKSVEFDTPFSLLRHRHLSMENIEECIVCCVMEKHGYSFKEENINIGLKEHGLNLNYVKTPLLTDFDSTSGVVSSDTECPSEGCGFDSHS